MLIYQVAVGECPPFYRTCIASVARYAAKYGHEHIVQREPELRIRPVKSARSENALRLGYLPIMEKQVALAHLARHDKVAVIDADVFVRDSAPDIFAAAGEGFSGVLERDLPCTPDHRVKLRKHSEGQFRSLTDVDWKWNGDGAAFYNCGVMVWGQEVVPHLNGQTPGEFLRRPEFERFVNGEGHWKWSTDQTLLNWWVKKSGMPTLDLEWKWNALYGVSDVKGAHFVHFFLSSKQPGIERAIGELCGT
jgi:hypothetical protein